MAKLPQSSRPDRRKPSKTFPHPFQRDVFAPTLASSMNEIGIVARIIAGLFLPLILAYVTTSTTLPDESAIKATYYRHAFIITGIAAFFAAVEFMRTMRLLDTEKLGRFPKYALITLTFVGAFCLFAGVANLISLHAQGREQRLEETRRREAERQRQLEEQDRLRKDAEAQCTVQKAKDVEALTKRRNSASSEQKKCVAEWVSPGVFSKETAESHCAPKTSAANRSSQELKDRQAIDCAAAAKSRYP